MDTTNTSKQVTFSQSTLLTFLSLFTTAGVTMELSDARRITAALNELTTALAEFGLTVAEEDKIEDGDIKHIFKVGKVASEEGTPSDTTSQEVPVTPIDPNTQTPING